jgi:transcription elongation factor/antiterminator RfaH
MASATQSATYEWDNQAASGEPAQWYAIQTRPRHEKSAAAELGQKGITTFLPLVTHIHRWSDRRKKVELPLFTGYAFVNIAPTPETRVSVLRTNGVLNFVGSHNHGAPIPESQIQGIRSLLANKIPFSPHCFLKVGQRVRIRGGCLEGVEGILIRHNGDQRLVLSVDMIQRSLAISIEGYDVEPV